MLRSPNIHRFSLKIALTGDVQIELVFEHVPQTPDKRSVMLREEKETN